MNTYGIIVAIIIGIIVGLVVVDIAVAASPYPYPVPKNCTEWRADAGGEGPAINGQVGIWGCTDMPDGTFMIEWPGVH